MISQLKNKLTKDNRGFVIIEVLASAAIGLVIFTAINALIFNAIKTSRINKENLKEIMYLQEMIEVSKDLEQSEVWSTGQLTKTDSSCLSPNVCYLDTIQSLNLKTWVFSTTPELLDGYTRSLTVDKVCRDSLNKMVSCDGTNEDQNTKKITATISWNNGSRTLEAYLYNTP